MKLNERYPAGRNLDALIAEKVMGLEVVETVEETGQGDPNGIWQGEYYAVCVQWAMRPGHDEPDVDDCLLPYSTDIAAAWQVVQRVQDRLGDEYYWQIVTLRGGKTSALIGWEYVPATRRKYICTEMADTAPHAICLAALAALEGRRDA